MTLAQELAKDLIGGEVLGLVGDLGSGKTVFVQGLAKALGVKEAVSSPTFVLMKSYATKKGKYLIHVDAYRLTASDQLADIGLAEYFGRPDSIVVIEWADQVADFLPPGSMIIKFKEGKDESDRIIEINPAPLLYSKDNERNPTSKR